MRNHEKLKKEIIQRYLSEYGRNSTHYREIEAVLNEMLKYCSHLLLTQKDFDLFYEYLPSLIAKIPYDSEQSPLGHQHCYDADFFKQDAENANNLQEFLKPYLFQLEDAKALKYFFEYRPMLENAPAHSNEQEDYRAILSYSSQVELEWICKQLRMDLKKLKKENCFHSILNDIPVFIVLSCDELKKTGNIEIHIHDSENPYCVTEKSAQMAVEADRFLRKALVKEIKK